jgi:hypothetical protein
MASRHGLGRRYDRPDWIFRQPYRSGERFVNHYKQKAEVEAKMALAQAQAKQVEYPASWSVHRLS